MNSQLLQAYECERYLTSFDDIYESSRDEHAARLAMASCMYGERVRDDGSGRGAGIGRLPEEYALTRLGIRYPRKSEMRFAFRPCKSHEECSILLHFISFPTGLIAIFTNTTHSLPCFSSISC